MSSRFYTKKKINFHCCCMGKEWQTEKSFAFLFKLKPRLLGEPVYYKKPTSNRQPAYKNTCIIIVTHLVRRWPNKKLKHGFDLINFTLSNHNFTTLWGPLVSPPHRNFTWKSYFHLRSPEHGLKGWLYWIAKEESSSSYCCVAKS